MPATIDITLDQLTTALGNLLQGIIGNDPATGQLVPVIVGLQNRIATPKVAFMSITPFHDRRTNTNVSTYDPNAQTQKSQQNIIMRMELDIYAPLAGDWVNMITTLWRDRYSCDALAPTCQPLYHDAPINVPLVMGEEQYETRWTVNLFLQYNPTTTTSLQSATALSVNVFNVDEKYPP